MIKNKLVDIRNLEKVFEAKHSKGLKLSGYGWNKFKYEKCEPENYRYYIEIHTKDKNKSEYSEYISKKKAEMWEYVFQYDEWYCFRRKGLRDEADHIREIDMEKSFAEIKRNIHIAIMLLAIIVFYICLVNDKSILGNMSCAFILILEVLFFMIYIRKWRFMKNLLKDSQ